MVSSLYQMLADLGYHHPLHPVLAHLPVGAILAGFLFLVTGSSFRRRDFLQTAHHCTILAFFMAIPTAILGYLDWQHFHGGAALFAIKAKMVMALALLFFVAATIFMRQWRSSAISPRFCFHLLAVLMVTGLLFFGGELVYGRAGAMPSAPTSNPAMQTTIDTVFISPSMR